jgi:hypothetical protein
MHTTPASNLPTTKGETMNSNDSRPSRLNTRQRAFLRTMCDEVLTPEELMKKCDLPGHVFNAWLRRKSFRRELSRTMRAMSKQCNVEIAIGAKVGSRTLAQQAKYAADGHVRRLSSVNLVSLNIDINRIARSVRKRKATEASELSPPDLPPDLDRAEAERLLRILEGEAPTPSPGVPGEGATTETSS